MRKTCTTCKQKLSIEEFNKNKAKKDGLQNTCKACNTARSKRYYEENAESHKALTAATKRARRLELTQRINAIKRKYGCQLCPERDEACLDFHHVEASKIFEVSKAAGHGRSWEKIIDEINKCVVVCANCHRKIHAGRKRVELTLRCQELQ